MGQNTAYLPILAGAVPSSLGRLSALATLELNNNQFSQQLPASLGDLGNLTKFVASHNRLSGHLPATIGRLASLVQLHVNCNALTGTYVGRPLSLASCIARSVLRTHVRGGGSSDDGWAWRPPT
jgi:hypothetical protein